MNDVAPSTALKIARGKVWMYKNDEEGDTHPWRVCIRRYGACQTTLTFETYALARKARGVVVRGICGDSLDGRAVLKLTARCVSD